MSTTTDTMDMNQTADTFPSVGSSPCESMTTGTWGTCRQSKAHRESDCSDRNLTDTCPWDMSDTHRKMPAALRRCNRTNWRMGRQDYRVQRTMFRPSLIKPQCNRRLI